MSLSLKLPNGHGGVQPYALHNPVAQNLINTGKFNRTVYAAAHIVVDPCHDWVPTSNFPVVDWDATLAYRHHLWKNGFGIAEAMDTAQRGMGIEWKTAQELIVRTLREMQTVSGATAVFGAGTDHLAVADCRSLEDVYRAYMEQIGVICEHGGTPVIMASRAMAYHAQSADDYIKLYKRLIDNSSNSVVLHWLGDVFDPQLAGYWGSSDVAECMDTVLEIIAQNTSKVDGIKISLLEKHWEISMRKRLPDSVKMFTGDDFNYDEMIAGDGDFYSHGLLGIFDAIAPVAGSALTKLAQGDEQGYYDIMTPTVPLSKKIFESPTPYYKAGVVFIAWLNGHQDHFVMAGGMQGQRSIVHYAELFKLADQCHVLANPELAIERMQHLLTVHGITA